MPKGLVAIDSDQWLPQKSSLKVAANAVQETNFPSEDWVFEMSLEIVSIERDAGERSLPEWGDALRAYVGGVPLPETTRCISTGQDGFSGRIDFGRLDGAVLSRIVASPHIFGRSETSPNAGASLMLLAVVSGSCRVHQDSNSCTLNSGQWCLYDPLKPFKVSAIEVRNECLALTLERPTDPECLDLLDKISAHELDAKSGMSRVLFATLTEAFHQMNRLGPFSENTLKLALSQMTWSAVRESLGAPPQGVHRDVLCARIKSYVERHVAEPALSVDEIARAFGMSVRSVHRAFEADSSRSISNYLWWRRLNHCAACLRDPAQADRSITDICLSFGFNSTSHFSRLFKEEFGLSPSEYRTAFSPDSPFAFVAV